jgi:hypothetical protein
LSAIYAATTYLKRRKLWNSLNALQNQHTLPWCFIGDFNSILGAHEHRGGVVPARLPMEEFQKWIDDFNLIHLQKWTPYGKNSILLDFKLNMVFVASQFKFLRMWTTHPECETIIIDCWNVVIIGCPMYILCKKLKLVKENLKIWNKSSFGNVHELVQAAENHLNHIHDHLNHNGPSDELLMMKN